MGCLLCLGVLPLLVEELGVEEDESLVGVKYNSDLGVISGLASIFGVQQLNHLDLKVLADHGDLTPEDKIRKKLRDKPKKNKIFRII